MRRVEEILRKVCGFLNEKGITYAIVGGFAVIFHGVPRTTMDIDMVIQLSEGDVPALVEFLRREGFYANMEDMLAALKEGSHCTVEDRETMFRLDIKGVYTEMDRATLKNRVKFTLGGVDVYVASPEDTIAGKLLFGSERDLEDALGIYVRQFEVLDMEYLEAVCRKLGIHSALEELRRKYRGGG